jgi:hypothetical protein
MATSVQVTFDCADPDGLAHFWASALGYQLAVPPGDFTSWEEFLTAQGVPEDQWDSASAVVDPDGVGPRLFFQKVPEAKQGKNRVHLDVNVGGGRAVPEDERKGRVHAAAERLTGEGAARREVHDEAGEFWIVMVDPEGNENCLQ